MQLAARCMQEQCGILFETKNIVAGSTRGVSFVGGTVTCPRCRGSARILDGTYDMNDGNAQLVSGPRWSRELFEELQAVIEQSKARGDTPEQTLEKVKETAPAAVGWLTSPKVLGVAAVVGAAGAIVSALAAVAQVVLAANPPTLTDDDIRRIAGRVTVEQRMQEPHPRVEKQLPRASPKEHGGDTAKRIPNAEYKPQKYKGHYKSRAKGKR